MMQQGLGYVLRDDFQRLYKLHSWHPDMAQLCMSYSGKEFTKPQLMYDSNCLMGAIMSMCTPSANCQAILAHRKTGDGILAYIELTDEYAYGGCKEAYVLQLQEQLQEKYSAKHHGDLASFVRGINDTFSELATMGVMNTDSSMKNQLKSAFIHHPDILAYIHLADRPGATFRDVLQFITQYDALAHKSSRIKNSENRVNTLVADYKDQIQEDYHSMAYVSRSDLIIPYAAYQIMKQTPSGPQAIKEYFELRKNLYPQYQNSSFKPIPVQGTNKSTPSPHTNEKFPRTEKFPKALPRQ